LDAVAPVVFLAIENPKFRVCEHVRALSKGRMLPHFRLRSAAADQFFWQSRIDNLKSRIVKAPLAQLAEQLTLNQRVAGSIPARCIRMKNGWFTRLDYKDY
jgi:hypothetical protein